LPEKLKENTRLEKLIAAKNVAAREVICAGLVYAEFVSVNWHSKGRFPALSNRLGKLDGGM